jgi:1-acyl-sn-glycerol-3-phosphate acyltransferase
MTSQPAPVLYRGRSWWSRLARNLIDRWYRGQGWTVEGGPPPVTRFVVIAAPHTSNWDLPFLLGASQRLGVKLNWMGKDTLFRWPFGAMMRRMGGIPVDRSRSTNAVAQMIEQFSQREVFMLTIAPEGTRSKVSQWRTGFYQIAHGAGVPLVCGFLDYRRKVGGLGLSFMPSGDYEADMVRIMAFYHDRVPRQADQTISR